MIRATRNGELLGWEELGSEQPGHKELECIMTDARTTFTLHLALLGWPLKRSERQWKNRASYCDCNGPEGLADKIRYWEGEVDDDG